MQAQIAQQISIDPFEIIHNFRVSPQRRQKPQRKVSACERIHHASDFTIKTRKMTAQIELKQYFSPETIIINQQTLLDHIDPYQKMEESDFFLLKNEDDLENAIPFDQQPNKDALFSLEENSYASNYSKLQRTLFGFSIHDEEMEQQ